MFTAAMQACEKESQWEQALSLLGVLSNAGWTLDTISFNAAISACEKGEQWDQAKSLREAGMSDDVGSQFKEWAATPPAAPSAMATAMSQADT